jgi:hypothetical protein
MFFGRFLICIVVTLSLASCWTGKQLDPPAYYNNPAPVDTNKIRFDGYYTNVSESDYSQSKYIAVNEIFFTSKNKIHVSHGARVITDSTMFTCKYYKNYDQKKLGTYIIEGNKISAFVAVAVAKAEGAWYPIYKPHFSGTIVNKDSITKWNAVPPFPKRLKKRDMKGNDGMFKEREMKFVRVDSIRCLTP